jgi:hypothetical protein
MPQSTFTSSSSTVNKDCTQSQKRFYVSQSDHVKIQLWTGWSFCQSMPRPASTINPTQGNQNMARTPIYKKCYKCGQKSHFANVCPNQRYCPDVTKVPRQLPTIRSTLQCLLSTSNSSKGPIQQNKAM